ncbi:mechanosensitive ion channel [Rhodobacter sp. SGA-6-6]|uniref:mechanosensitive ion channel domain-containing protein n=1 Tax=Rhodobacter sp. SGA-6-6 TaxID=2710882 RepID=UPI0013EE275C|nr:mechanosensitive ion channel [Rhodobacter sp. SGA-6-6]
MLAQPLSLPGPETLRLWRDLLDPVWPGALLAVAVLLAGWIGLTRWRSTIAARLRETGGLRRRLTQWLRYLAAALLPLLAALLALLVWAALARPDRPELERLLRLLLPVLAAAAVLALVNCAFTLLSAFGRRATREITRRLPPQLGLAAGLMVAALLLRQGVPGLTSGPAGAAALALETAAALIGLRAAWQQRQTLRQLLKGESATPDEDPPTLPERVTGWVADHWHLLAIGLILAGMAGRYGLFGPDHRTGLFADLLLALALLAIAGVGILLAERLHGHILGRMQVVAGTGLRDRLALRLGRVIRTGVQIAVALWTASAIAALWWPGLRQDGTAVTAGLTTLVALYALWVIWTLVDTLLDWSASHSMGRGTRIRTLLPFLRNFAFIVVATLAAISVLSNLGVDVAPLLAGAGVVGIAIGIGAQKLVGDVITGIFIIFEDSIAIGETVEAAGKTGVVEGLTIRTLKLRDGDGALHSIPFSSITTLKNNSRGYGAYTISATILNPEDTDRALAEIGRIGREIAQEPEWQSLVTGPFSLWGVDQITPTGVVIKGNIRSHPNAQWALGREINRRIALRFSELGIAQVQTQPLPPPPV